MADKYGWAREHRVVAYEAGLLAEGDDRHVHHRNHVKTDNRLENLEVLTPRAHAAEHRRLDPMEARRLYESGMTMPDVAAALGTHSGNVSRLVRSAGGTARPHSRTAVDERLIADMLEFGVPVRSVMSALHVGETTVRRVAAENAIPTPRPGRPRAGTPTSADFLRRWGA